jgi:hypothetical protein
MQRLSRLRPAVVAAVLIAIGAVRMATTWRVFSATADEALHVGAGLEVLQYHRYLLQRENPPLPPVIFAIAPWLGGMRYDPHGTFSDQIHSVVYDHGDYKANLFRARAGTVVFFILASIALFFAARDALGESGALLALFLFTMEPIVLGYSALATLDGAATAGVAVALLTFARWLRQPRMQNALLFGAAYGFSVLCKFSCIVYVAVACAGFALVRIAHDGTLRRRLPRAAATLLPAAAMTLLVIWAGYGFTIGTTGELNPWNDAFGPAVQRFLEHLNERTPLPASPFFAGIASLLKIDKGGFLTFLCGKVSTSGWWWYFPFAVSIKTTFGLLALFAAGLFFGLRDRTLRWTLMEWSAAAAAIIAVTLPSTLDLGIRYILPFYVPFAIAAGAGALAMMRSSRAGAALATALLLCQLTASAFAHPDYFPYFNLFAGRDPSRYLVDSNIDWGQDILRLRTIVRREKMSSLSQSLMGPADYAALGFPPMHPVSPWTGSHGWVAVSDHSYQMTKTEGGWRWLPEKYERVGKSIRLYNIP